MTARDTEIHYRTRSMDPGHRDLLKSMMEEMFGRDTELVARSGEFPKVEMCQTDAPDDRLPFETRWVLSIEDRHDGEYLYFVQSNGQIWFQRLEEDWHTKVDVGVIIDWLEQLEVTARS